MASSPVDDERSLLEKIDAAVPTPLAQFDAFPKLPSTYKSRSESRGFMTVFVGFVAFLLMLNDIGEFIWGWPDHEFSVDTGRTSFMNVNIDLVVNMPCRYLSVDLRDTIGDRLFLTGGFRRDGVMFDVGQATALQAHSEALSVRQAVQQSRTSRGMFAALFSRSSSGFKPSYLYKAHGSACRVSGSLEVKKVTANLHITTLGHGYSSREHVDHKLMNLSHVITEFSFGPFFPEITQPLDNSFEVAQDPFVAYQYFLHVVPTTYVAPRSKPLRTHQYSVTHYTRVLQHNEGTPGIFFKFDLDPMSLTIHQRTTTFAQLIIRCVGVIGGIFVCMGYAIRITTRAVEVVSSSSTPLDVPASAASSSLRQKWVGGHLRSRASGRMVPQGSGWVLEGSPGSPSPYTPSSFSSPGSPYFNSPPPASVPSTPNPGSGVGLGFTPSTFGPHPNGVRSPSILGPRTPGSRPVSMSSYTSPLGPPSLPGTPAFGTGNANGGLGVNGGVPGSPMPPGTPSASYATFPPTPSPGSPQIGPPPRRGTLPKKDD